MDSRAIPDLKPHMTSDIIQLKGYPGIPLQNATQHSPYLAGAGES